MGYKTVSDGPGRRRIAERSGANRRVFGRNCGDEQSLAAAPFCISADETNDGSTPMTTTKNKPGLKALYIGTERGIRFYTVPSESAPDAPHHEIQVTQSKHCFCDCADFRHRYYRHYPTLSDTQWHCKHLKAVTTNCENLNEFLHDDGLCADDLCADCGAILEEVPVAIAPYDYKREWRCVACDAAREAVMYE